MGTQPLVLVSQSDIARHASVGRAAVANWRSRHKEFPPPYDEAAQLFDAIKVALWLDGRRIPMSSLAHGEIEGASYGTRFRRSLGLMPQSKSPTARRNDVVRLLDHVRSISLGEHHMRLLASLIHIRWRSPTAWSHLTSGNVRSEQVADAYQRTLPPDAPAVVRSFADIHHSEISVALISDSVRRVDRAFPDGAADPVLAADLLSELVDEYADKAGGKAAAEFFTPRSLTSLAVRLLQPSPSTQRIYDPYCRAGEFFAETSRYLEASEPGARIKVYGLHPNPHMCTLAWMVAAARGAEPVVDQGYWWDYPHQKAEFDLIFSNPPFNLPVPSELRGSRYWRYGAPPDHNSNFGWIQHVLERLRADGRAALVLPNNVGFANNPRERSIRRELVEDGVVDAVIALPGRLFRGTDIPVTMWLLSGPRPKAGILLIDARSEASRPSRGRRVLDHRTIERISQAYVLHRQGRSESIDGFARAVSVAELRHDDYRLQPARWIRPAAAGSSNEDPLGVLEQHTRSLILRSHGARENISFARKSTHSGHDEPWPIAVLADLCDVKSGPSGGKVRPGPESTGQIPVLLPRHIGRGPIRTDEVPSIPTATAESLIEYRLRPGDIVCARVGGLGRVALITDAENGWLMSAGLVRLRPNERIAASYLAHILRSTASRSWISRRSGGSFLPTLNVADLRQLPVTVPPLDEQHRVALFLDAIAEQAEAARELIEATDAAIDSVASTYFGVDNMGLGGL